MEFFEVISTRRSTRAWQARDVERDRLEKVLAVANMAPSAGDLQAYEIVVVRHATTKASLAAAAHDQAFIAEAPVVLVFFADPSRSAARYEARGERLFSIQDATIAASHAQLAATALGLASCWVGSFDDRRMAQTLGAPAEIRPVCMLAIGYAAERPERTSRRPLSDLTHDETFRR
jgi:nitroreductase